MASSTIFLFSKVNLLCTVIFSFHICSVSLTIFVNTMQTKHIQLVMVIYFQKNNTLLKLNHLYTYTRQKERNRILFFFCFYQV
jgi:hypothetical protein